MFEVIPEFLRSQCKLKDIQTGRQTDSQPARQKDSYINRQTARQIYNQPASQPESQKPNSESVKQKGRQTKTENQLAKQTDKRHLQILGMEAGSRRSWPTHHYTTGRVVGPRSHGARVERDSTKYIDN